MTILQSEKIHTFKMIKFLSFDEINLRSHCLYLTIIAVTTFAFSISACAQREAAEKEKATQNIKVYFNNDRLSDNPMDCAAVFPVSRTMDASIKPERAALTSLFQGPTSEEKEADYRSFFSAATKDLLKRVWVQNSTAYVDLADKRDVLSGATSSCGTAEFHSQIERTLSQFPSVKRVIYAFEGDSKMFYEWINEPCNEINHHCIFPTNSVRN